MNAHQKRTYLVYSRGLMPDELRLGSLFIDPANPLEGERKRFICPLSPEQIDAWVGDIEYDDDCALSVDVSKEWLLGAGVLDLVHGEFTDGKSRRILISGKSGRRVQMNKPESFLNDVLLRSSPAKAWLARQLSVSRTVYHLSRLKFGKSRYPQIWLLTGIQYITNASLDLDISKSHRIALGFTVPLPDPVLALTGKDVVSLDATHTRTHSASTGYSHKDERIWAAQFTRLNVRFSLEEAPHFDNYIVLKNLQDLGPAGVRGDDSPVVVEAFAEVDGLAEDETLLDAERELFDATGSVDWDLVDEFLHETNEIEG